MSDAQKLLDAYANSEVKPGFDREDYAPHAFTALQDVLDHCRKMETTDMGEPSLVGKAIADTFRGLIASALKD